MTTQSVFTEVIKDVIGNDPVLDQFDISYAASFYGTMQDDYITGSMIVDATLPFDTTKRLVTGSVNTRGRLFSKYLSDIFPVLPSTYGSDAVNVNPLLSYRLTSWESRVSTTSYRISQCYDKDERFYDSCLPDLNACFSADESTPWVMNNASNPTLLSPYNNTLSGNVGPTVIANLVFNYPESNRSNVGFTYDPVVNNDWTWSYPFESKYNPQNRVTFFNKSLGLSSPNLSADLSLIETKQLYNNNMNLWSISGSKSFEIKNITTNSTPKPVSSFRPILPGKLSKNVLSTNSKARNSLRQSSSNTLNGSLGSIAVIPSSYKLGNLDGVYGFSLLVPSEVLLNRLGDHNFITTASYSPAISDPGNEFLTGSSGVNDMIKFLFGFGDMNTMTFAERSFDSSAIKLQYTADFESIASDTLAKNIPSYDDGIIKINWNNNDHPGATSVSTWRVKEDDGTVVISGQTRRYFSYLSPPLNTRGVYWTPTTNRRILVSDTVVANGGSILDTGGDSYMAMDVTSSCPWSVSFGFAMVTDDPGDIFRVDITGAPGFRSQAGATPGYDNGVGPNLIKTDDAASFFIDPNTIITQTQLPGVARPGVPDVTGGTYSWQTHGSYTGTGDYGNVGSQEYPLPSGEYRIVFHYQYGCAAGPPSANQPYFVAIDNLAFHVYGENAFPSDTTKKTMGGNNYPEFRKVAVDYRPDPTYKVSAASWDETEVQDRTSDIYRGMSYGVSPVIRGWKYGLYNGLPTNSKAVFRRDRFGQFRDMLEQRVYTKFINTGLSPTDRKATTVIDPYSSNTIGYNEETDSRWNVSGGGNTTSPPAVSVRFVKEQYQANANGIGDIYTISVLPKETVSQNLSTEVTSSVPYFDGIARHRQESDINQFVNTNLTLTQITP